MPLFSVISLCLDEIKYFLLDLDAPQFQFATSGQSCHSSSMLYSYIYNYPNKIMARKYPLNHPKSCNYSLPRVTLNLGYTVYTSKMTSSIRKMMMNPQNIQILVFPEMGSTPLAGWFIPWKIRLKWMITGGTPMTWENLIWVAVFSTQNIPVPWCSRAEGRQLLLHLLLLFWAPFTWAFCHLLSQGGRKSVGKTTRIYRD